MLLFCNWWAKILLRAFFSLDLRRLALYPIKGKDLSGSNHFVKEKSLQLLVEEQWWLTSLVMTLFCSTASEICNNSSSFMSRKPLAKVYC